MIDAFFFVFLQGAEDVRRWGVSPPGVWMGGGVLLGDESRIENNTGEEFLFSDAYIVRACRAQQVSGVIN